MIDYDNILKDAISRIEEKKEIVFEDYMPPAKIVSYLERMDFIESQEFDTNGWDYDWWLTYSKGDLNLSFRGSGYYGRCSVWLGEE